MKTSEMLNQALENASQLEKIVKQIIREVDDYDLQRLLKKVDAEFMDVRHNLALARRLAEARSAITARSRRTARATLKEER